MTISRHIVFLKAGIAVSFLTLFVFAVFARDTLPVYNDLIGKAAQRSVSGLIAGLLPPPAPYAAFAGIGTAVLFAFVTQILLFYFFEKTQAIEARLFGMFLFSFAFEILRIAIPLKTVLRLSGYIPLITSRLMVFGRFYGLFALFAAGLYVSGLKIRREETIIFPMILAALLFAIRMPIDSFAYDTSLYPLTGFSSTFGIVNSVIVVLSILCFVSGAYTRGSHEYYFIALGILAAAIGRKMLLSADTWITLVSGAVLLFFGVWYSGAQLRRMYLWV
ncbi:MAG: hypothetical protein LBO04_03820 [Spirochaetaceae bacterium]|jgi:hypothetical protein|nr:hypothetical protein [Spirochaetaceae bacterium]